MTIFMNKWTRTCREWLMGSFIGQNPTFSCQQLVMTYCNGWLKRNVCWQSFFRVKNELKFSPLFIHYYMWYLSHIVMLIDKFPTFHEFLFLTQSVYMFLIQMLKVWTKTLLHIFLSIPWSLVIDCTKFMKITNFNTVLMWS